MSKIHYSWIVLSVAFFAIFVTGVVRSASGLYIIPFEHDFGWERAEVSTAFGLNLIVYGLASPFLASYLERFGVRKMMILGIFIISSGLILTLFMSQIWHLFLIWGIILGLGSGLFLTVLSPFIANTWFEKRKGLAIGILTASTAAGQLIFLPLLAYLSERYSWETTIWVMLLLTIMSLLLITKFMLNSPRELGIAPYGAKKTIEAPPVAHSQSKNNPFFSTFNILFDVFKEKSFWVLAMSFFICGLSTSGLIGTHFVAYCISFGFTAVAATSLLSLMGVFNIIGTTLSGFLTDRFDNRWLLFWYYILRGASLLILPFAISEKSMFLMIMFSIFYGLDWIATIPPTVNLTRQVFGVKKSGVVYGWIFVFHQIGAGFAASGAGLLFNIFDTYSWSFTLAGLFCVTASLFIFILKKPLIRMDRVSEKLAN